MDEVVREILARHGRISVPIADVDGGADLFALGLTSHAAVNVMLAIEDRLAIEFPDELMSKAVFASVDSLVGAVRSLAGDA